MSASLVSLAVEYKMQVIHSPISLRVLILYSAQKDFDLVMSILLGMYILLFF